MSVISKTLYLLYMVALLTAAVMAISRRKQLDGPGKVLAMLFTIAFGTELIALFTGMRFGNNYPVYIVYAWIELLLVTTYFIRGTRRLQKCRWLYVPVALAIAGSIWLLVQGYPLRKLHTRFLVFSCVMCLCLSLYALYQLLLQDDDRPITRRVHFWIPTLFNIYWVGNIFNWAVYEYLSVYHPEQLNYLHWSRLGINLVVYTGWSALFFTYHKLQSYAS